MAEQPPVRKPSTSLVLLSLVAVLLLGAAISFGVLYSNQTSRNAVISVNAADKQKEITDTEAKIDDNAKKLTESEESLRLAVDARQKAETDSAPLTVCYEAARKARQDVFGDDLDAYDATMKVLYINC
jgi:hypothetical protein